METSRPIITTLMDMKVGDVKVFPIAQRDSVKNTIFNHEQILKMRREGAKWDTFINLRDKCIIVRRIS